MWRRAGGEQKKQTAIEVVDVPRVFNYERIEQLATIGQLPSTADQKRFGEGVREAARIYATDARSPTAGTVRDEIAALYRAAERREYERAATLLAHLLPPARAHLEKRLKLPGPRKAKLRLPSTKSLLDHRRDNACEMIERVCRTGGAYVEGRMRPSGRRSTTWQPTLCAPVPDAHPPKRAAELRFVMHLQAAWLHAVGKPPTATVNPSRPDRPFRNLVKQCLELTGARADAIGLINELRRRRRDERQRLADLRRHRRR